jgi:hypothetical protein
MDLSKRVGLDLGLRYVDALPAFDVDGYLALDARLSWFPRDDLEITLIGHDLLERERLEYDSRFVSTVPTKAQRGIFGKVTWRF